MNEGVVMGMNKNVFDWHLWNADNYKTSIEIDSAIKSFGISGKTIKAVNVIGMAKNMEKESYIQNMQRTLANAGVSYENINSGRYPYINETLLPCEVLICEPVIFVFEDDTTFEIMPWRGDGIKMSVNQIPSNVVDGTNCSNFNSNLFFRSLIGKSIDRVQCLERTIRSQSGSSTYREELKNYTYQFWLKGEFGFFIRQSYEGWYYFGVTLQNHFMELGNATAKITYGEIKAASYDKAQITIVEGHDSSSYFWIMPVKQVERSDEYRFGVDEYRPEEISIEEDDIYEFLYYFLDKYFDSDFPYTCREFCGNDFQWNLEYNIYTYDSIRKMIVDIREYLELLQKDFHNPKLETLKKYYRAYSFVQDYFHTKGLPSHDQIIRDNINVAISFYERFCRRMEAMMEYAPEYELISFMGP
ncbi:hypothetical protein ACPWSR_00630 [Alloiococcus sp. CFN-8]|uniref:hypothetical protein n=1 Tax=Alloiococcus sp. CFN-8 TaxID=3416081 RepID=UPI003CF79EA1